MKTEAFALELAKKPEVDEPEAYSNPLDLARPIEFILEPEPVFSVPLADVSLLYKPTFLKAATSPETNPTSGEPYTLLTYTKLPISNLVLELFCVSNDLALFTSTKLVPIVSISKPLTYALPGARPAAILVSNPPFPDAVSYTHLRAHET